MIDLAFYNAGGADRIGLRMLIVLPRRLIRRILRPFFQRQVELFQSICDRLDAAEKSDTRLQKDLLGLQKRQGALGQQLEPTQALAWDYLTLVPRIADLEDRIEALLEERERQEDHAESVPFPSVAADPSRARAS